MTAVLTVVAILALTFGVVYLIAVDHYRELRAWDDYLAAVREDAVNEAAWDEAMALANEDRPTPLRDSDAANRVAANEAARADWSTVERWER